MNPDNTEETIPHDLNKTLDASNKELRETKRREFNEKVAQGVEYARKNGAKEREIGAMLKKEYEDRKHGNQDPLGNEPPGTILSEVTAQQIDWLWQRRIPLGKITILDGDPGMGKSLLAINIAACLSTGRAMPDGTPGKQGSVILIAPEDSAEDTIKPRMEARLCHLDYPSPQ